MKLRVFYILCAMVATLLGLASCFPQLLEHGPLLYVAYAPQAMYLLLPLPFLPLALIKRKRAEALLAAYSFLVLLLPAGLHLTFASKAGEGIEILSLNADSWKTNPGALELFSSDHQRSDVIFFQEMWTQDICDRCARSTPELKWYRHPLAAGVDAEIAIATRLPVRRKLTLPGELEESVLALEVEYHGNPLILCNMHLPKKEDTVTTWPPASEINRLQLRNVELMVKLLEDTGLPVLIAGDRNCTPMSPSYQRLACQYSDAFSQVGCGFGYTFPAICPVWRIDGFFISAELQASGFEVLPACGSDHRPIRATVHFK